MAVFAEMRSWVADHTLKMNDERAASSKYYLHAIPLSHARETPMIDGEAIEISDMARDLGMILDRHLNMEAITMPPASFIRSAGFVVCYPGKPVKNCACDVTSRNEDYCNSLLYGLPARTLCHLQRVQSMAARIVIKTSKYDHIN